MRDESVPRNVLFVSNQGGDPVVDLKTALALEFARLAPAMRRRVAVLSTAQAERVRAAASNIAVESFEEHRHCSAGYDLGAERRRLLREYPQTNWSRVLLSERTFFDVSNLDGGIGERRVCKEYVERLLVELVRFFESVLELRPDLVVAQTPDSLMTLVLYHVARGRGIPLRGLCPAWITPGCRPAGFLTEDEFLHAPAMRRADLGRAGRPLTEHEITRADSFRDEIRAFDANAVYKAVTGVAFGRSVLSPNVTRLFSYLRSNESRRPEVEYFKVDPLRKFVANMKRLVRKSFSQSLLGPRSAVVPPRAVFFPLHFQPEASTLVGGIDHADQAATAEAILRALPLGWSLVVKEHPAGRGTRPLSHYRRLLRYPNVVFCDAPSKSILPHVDAVVTVTGTVGIEALAFDKPVVMLGQWFWDHCALIYRPSSPQELAAVLRSILVDGSYSARPDREDQIRRFLLSYLDGLIPATPRLEGAAVYAKELVAEIGRLNAAQAA